MIESSESAAAFELTPEQKYEFDLKGYIILKGHYDAVAVARRALTLTQDQGLTDEITAHLRLFEQRKTITPG